MLFNSIAQVQLLKKLTFHWFQAWDGVLPYSLGGSVLLGLRKFYPLLEQILQVL